jgi:hypothetical protein
MNIIKDLHNLARISISNFSEYISFEPGEPDSFSEPTSRDKVRVQVQVRANILKPMQTYTQINCYYT